MKSGRRRVMNVKSGHARRRREDLRFGARFVSAQNCPWIINNNFKVWYSTIHEFLQSKVLVKVNLFSKFLVETKDESGKPVSRYFGTLRLRLRLPVYLLGHA